MQRRWRSAPDAIAGWGERVATDAGTAHERGLHLTLSYCGECQGRDLAGHAPPLYRPDLTIAASYDRVPFDRLIRTGVALGDREVGLMSEVARPRFVHLAAAETGAIQAYVRACAALRQGYCAGAGANS